jgi:transposase
VPISPDQLPDEPEALKRIIAAMAQDAVNAQAEIAKLRFQLARYRRAELLWTYVRDERPFNGDRPPAALFFYSPDRKGEHPRAHLKDFRGVIHADGYAGFRELFAGNRIAEAGCWAHVRRKFFDVHAAIGSPIAKEALDRIGQLYGVEEMIKGFVPDHRRRERQQ